MKHLKLGDVAIHYQTVNLTAKKPVIAFANSLGTDFRIWDAVIEELGDRFGYVLHDKRGHGLSDCGAAPYSIETHADDLIGLLDHLNVDRAIIWGLSVGGMIAQSVFNKRADLARALILSNTAHRMGSADMWSARIDGVRTHGLSGLVDPIMERWFTSAFRRTDNPLYSVSRNMLARQSPDGYCGTCDALRHADFTDVARTIAVPTLCVAGDQDGAAPPDLVKSLADLIPSSAFVEIASCGHIPCVEQPAAYSKSVLAFLTQLPEL